MLITERNLSGFHSVPIHSGFYRRLRTIQQVPPTNLKNRRRILTKLVLKSLVLGLERWLTPKSATEDSRSGRKLPNFVS